MKKTESRWKRYVEKFRGKEVQHETMHSTLNPLAVALVYACTPVIQDAINKVLPDYIADVDKEYAKISPQVICHTSAVSNWPKDENDVKEVLVIHSIRFYKGVIWRQTEWF